MFELLRIFNVAEAETVTFVVTDKVRAVFPEKFKRAAEPVPTSNELHKAFALMATVCPLAMVTSVEIVGTTLLLQTVASFQLPFLVEFTFCEIKLLNVKNRKLKRAKILFIKK